MLYKKLTITSSDQIRKGNKINFTHLKPDQKIYLLSIKAKLNLQVTISSKNYDK